MPTINISHESLRYIQSRYDIVHDPQLLVERLGLIGCSVESCDDESIEIEVFPDRPDMLSAETLAHVIRPFLHDSEATPSLQTNSSNVTLDVEVDLEHIRPIIYGAIVKGVDVGKTFQEKDDFIQGLMEHQEKLHFSLGRGRSRASIGVHDLSSLSPPFKVKAVDENYKFIPLAMNHEMSIKEILESHPKGIDYAHLLESMSRYPVIVDNDDKVLSFPPIINGNHTTVKESTTDFFIDVTGWEKNSCEASLLLICLAFSARGGTVETISINDCHNKQITTPDGSVVEHLLSVDLLEDILGKQFDDGTLKAAINRMGGDFAGRITTPEGNSQVDYLKIKMPRWRFDILHPIDLVEEVAIGHGYENIGKDIPKSPLPGIPSEHAEYHRRIRDSIQGHGFQQVQSLTLSNQKDEFELMRWNHFGELSEIANPITVEHTILRQSVLPSLMRLLATNKHHELPQKVYELGTVVRSHNNSNRIAWLAAERGSGFANSRGIVQTLLKDMGLMQTQTVEWIPIKDGPWLEGRGCKIEVDGVHIGEIGEIDPKVSSEFELRVPIHGGELDISNLITCLPDPVRN